MPTSAIVRSLLPFFPVFFSFFFCFFSFCLLPSLSVPSRRGRAHPLSLSATPLFFFFFFFFFPFPFLFPLSSFLASPARVRRHVVVVRRCGIRLRNQARHPTRAIQNLKWRNFIRRSRAEWQSERRVIKVDLILSCRMNFARERERIVDYRYRRGWGGGEYHCSNLYPRNLYLDRRPTDLEISDVFAIAKHVLLLLSG